MVEDESVERIMLSLSLEARGATARRDLVERPADSRPVESIRRAAIFVAVCEEECSNRTAECYVGDLMA